MTQVLTAPLTRETGPSLRHASELATTWRLVIAEDSDDYLRSRTHHEARAALGRLLNLADGTLGQGMTVLVLLATNEDTGRLHPATNRPGRCLASVEYPPLDPAEATRWLGEPVTGPATLAGLLHRAGTFGTHPTTRTFPTPGQYL